MDRVQLFFKILALQKSELSCDFHSASKVNSFWLYVPSYTRDREGPSNQTACNKLLRMARLILYESLSPPLPLSLPSSRVCVILHPFYFRAITLADHRGKAAKVYNYSFLRLFKRGPPYYDKHFLNYWPSAAACARGKRAPNSKKRLPLPLIIRVINGRGRESAARGDRNSFPLLQVHPEV